MNLVSMVVVDISIGLPSKPGVPEFEKIDRDRISLKWTAPKSDGGTDIFNYVIECRAEGAFKWKRCNDDTVPLCRYTVKGLREKEVYEFRVSAENRAGVGPSSEATLPTKAEEKVGKFISIQKELSKFKTAF